MTTNIKPFITDYEQQLQTHNFIMHILQNQLQK
jgi:hypothetical protein